MFLPISALLVQALNAQTIHAQTLHGVFEGAPPEPAEELAFEGRPPEPAEVPTSPLSENAAPAEPSTFGESLLPAGELLPASPRELLELYGVDESNFLVMIDEEPISDAEREVLLRVLYRVRKFSRVDIADWLVREEEFSYANLRERPDDYRGKIVPVLGRMLEVVLARPPREVKARYEMEEFFFCKLQLAGSEETCWLVTSVLPKPLQTEGAANERVSATGMFMKVSASPDGSFPLVFIAPRLAWHPDRLEEDEGVNLGMTILGDLAVDVGLLDEVEDRRRIIDREREIFYQMLWGVGHAGTNQLERQAFDNLKMLEKTWQAEVDAFDRRAVALREEMDAQQIDKQEQRRRLREMPGRKDMLIAQRCVKDAQRKRFSVFPLFNRSEENRGQLVVLEGTARRAMPIQLGKGLQRGQANHDVVSRFDIDHYYEVEIFTDDSQNNPIVFCVRQLPPGFPEGEAINEPVRIAGFFLKSWSYFTQQPADIQPDGTIHKRQQLAPLLVGREPTWIQREPAERNSYIGMAFGGLFISAVVGAWFFVWRFNRRDKEFHARFVGPHRAAAEGQSLDELGLEAQDGPDFRHLEE